MSLRRGFAYIIVIVFASLLLIFFVIMGKLRQTSSALLSKSARNYLATTVAEAGLNCVLAELRYDWGFRTHWYYKKGLKKEWTTPVKAREANLAALKPMGFFPEGVVNGIYAGSIADGEFKARCAPVYGSRGNAKTKTLDEKEMYMRVEVVARVGDRKAEGGPSHRKVVSLIERRSPASEHILFDGEMLDLGLGPFAKVPNILRRGRLYGYQYITFNTAGGSDQGSEILETEKIETPGFIRALVPTRVEFADRTTIKLDRNNDSTQPQKFKTYDGFLLDGPNGAHPIKPILQRDRILARAERYKATYGVVIDDSGPFPIGNYKNPYDPTAKYVDLDFGAYRCDEKPASSGSESSGEDDEEKPDSSAPPYNGDDPDPLHKRRGKSLLLFSKAPLRIWGCPDRNVTIFCDKDVVIAGDFNQNPLTPQDYPNTDFMDYKTAIMNGKGGHKIGALIMSMGRVFVDVSQPALFMKNEMRTYFLYELCMALHPSEPKIEEELRRSLFSPDPTTIHNVLGLGEAGPDGLPTPGFGTISWLFWNKDTNDGPAYDANLADLIDFLTPGGPSRPRFGIRDPAARTRIIEFIRDACRTGAQLDHNELHGIFDLAWGQAIKEANEKTDLSAGPMGLMDSFFDMAAKDLKDGLFMPEISINAAIVSSTRRSAKWQIGNAQKTFEEIGNVSNTNAGLYEYLKPPRFLIRRIYGADIRLATAKPEYFVDGRFSPKNILRRNIWDSKLTNTGFKPVELPQAYNILTYSEESISAQDYDEF